MDREKQSLLRTSLDILLPRSCALCGRDLLGAGRPYPLCKACEEGLTAPGGDLCQKCGKPLISEIGLCMRCRNREFHFDAAYPLWSYDGSVKEAVLAYKIAEVRTLARFFAERLEAFLASRFPGIPIVPVPFRRGKMRKKGWDQVEDIARILERRGLPVARCLERLAGSSQKELDYGRRLSNLSGKILLRKGEAAPRQAVLLDDVLTTGATLSECARVLKSHGSERVDAVVLAAD